jgi:DNA primase
MTSWEELIDRYGLAVKWQGRQWRGTCPVHRGDSVSAFVITPGRGFHCFVCGIGGGGTASFLRLMGDDAVAADLADSPLAERVEVAPVVSPSAPLVPLDATHPYLRERGIHEATARYFGAGYRSMSPLARRIVVPLHDATGNLVGHIGRAVDEKTEPRYCFQRGVRRGELLFNLHRVKQAKAETVIVVEGVFDALAVYQIGMPNVVATLGCEVTATQRALLSGFRRILVLFDDDNAGMIAAAKLIEEFGPTATRLQLPKADPASIKGVLLERVIRAAESLTLQHR